MRKIDKAILLSLSLALLLPMPAMAKEGKVTRIYGKDRYETSLKVADELSNSYEKIIVANGEIFSDALSGSILTEGKYPIVLTAKDKLDSSVKAKISKAKEVYILGGSETISLNVENDIKSLGKKVSRVQGIDRYETSVKIADITRSKDLVLVNGDIFPDSLIASGIALLSNKSILLVKSNEIPKSVEQYIKNVNPSSITIIGGNKSVSDSIEKAAKALSKNVSRISGKDRYSTSLEVAKQFKDLKNMIIASGESFSDALSASSIAGKLKAPIILIDGKNDAVALKYIENNKKGIDNLKIVGGPRLISENIYKSIENVFIEAKDNKKPIASLRPNSSAKPESDKIKPNPKPDSNPQQPKLADKPANGIWYGTAFEGYGVEQYGASIVKVEIRDGKIKSSEAIKHCASDSDYINLSKKLLPTVKDKNTSDIDSIIKELSNEEYKNHGEYADAVTGATRTSRGYAIAIKNAIERARKFEADKKEQKIAYIKITGDNADRPGFDRSKIADKSNLKNGIKADFDFVSYDIAMSDGTILKDVKFSELEKYNITSNYKQNEVLNSDNKDSITLTVQDETGYAVETIRLAVKPKVEKFKVRPTHALITFAKSADSGDAETKKVDIQEDRFAYDLGTFNQKIEKVELFKDDKLISTGVFHERFNYWWFDIKYDLNENEMWEHDKYRITTRIVQPIVPKPEKPESPNPEESEAPKPPQKIEDYYPAKYVFKDKKTKEKVAEIVLKNGEWAGQYSKKISDKEISNKYEDNLNNDSFEVEAFNKENQKIEVKSINVMSGGKIKMHEVKTIVSKEEDADERTLLVFWKFI